MDVKRSDMLKWAQSAQLDSEPRSSAADKPEVTAAAPKAQVTVDTMRSKVFSLQQEIRDLQTGISMRQIQLGFLNQVNEGSSWQKELKRFMNEQFPAMHLELADQQELGEFKTAAAQAVDTLRHNLIKKEIQIQNILSAGMFEPVGMKEEQGEANVDNAKIMRDFNESRAIFSKLRPDAVKNLVN